MGLTWGHNSWNGFAEANQAVWHALHGLGFARPAAAPQASERRRPSGAFRGAAPVRYSANWARRAGCDSPLRSGRASGTNGHFTAGSYSESPGGAPAFACLGCRCGTWQTPVVEMCAACSILLPASHSTRCVPASAPWGEGRAAARVRSVARVTRFVSRWHHEEKSQVRSSGVRRRDTAGLR